MIRSYSSTSGRFDWLGLAFTILLAIVIAVPLLVVFTWAFTEVWRYPSVIPQKFGLRFWDQTLSRADVWEALFISLRLSATVTALSALICLPAAYAFARMTFPGRDLFFLSFLASHAFPKFGLLVAIAAIFLQLNLIATFWGVVLIQLVGTLMLMIWIPVAAFQAVDRRMERLPAMWAPDPCASSGRSRCRRPGRRSLRPCC